MWEWDERVAHCNGQKRACKLPPQNIKSRIRTKIIYVPFSRKLYLVTKSACTFATHTHTQCATIEPETKCTKSPKDERHMKKNLFAFVLFSRRVDNGKKMHTTHWKIFRTKTFTLGSGYQESLWVCYIAPIDRITNLHFFSGILKLCEKNHDTTNN